MKVIFTRSFGAFRKDVEYDLPENRYKLFVERMRIAKKVEEVAPVQKVQKPQVQTLEVKTNQEPVLETLQFKQEVEEEDKDGEVSDEPKKRGRPKKEYETKVLIADVAE